MKTHNLGYPRIGDRRQLKKACEGYWKGTTSYEELISAGTALRKENFLLQKEAGIDVIPCNDFSFYDQVLDMALMTGAVPERYKALAGQDPKSLLDLYFAMARGIQKEGLDIPAMEMTKWFDTNYHYIVPEFTKDQDFSLWPEKVLSEYREAKELGLNARPVLIGPVSFLLLGKEKEPGFDRIDLLEDLLPVYEELLRLLKNEGAEWVQMDEPFLVTELTGKEKKAFVDAYRSISGYTRPGILLATYFGGLGENTELACKLPVEALHVDMVKDPDQLQEVLDELHFSITLSLGVVDGRNIWRNNMKKSLFQVHEAVKKLGSDRVMVGPSCSLLHVPCDLSLEDNEKALPPQVKYWMAFARQKLHEISSLADLLQFQSRPDSEKCYKENLAVNNDRRNSPLIHNEEVKERMNSFSEDDYRRFSSFPERKEVQKENTGLPLYPTTTIGSFPQTAEIRRYRRQYKKSEISQEEYYDRLKNEIQFNIKQQQEVGLDVLVHGEPERNDMVEYFGELLKGFAITQNGWVQSYGSRCVKPPILYGDVDRDQPMTTEWIRYAQSLTDKPVKGMLTGPVTILRWSFVRDDQSEMKTALQVAAAIRDEVQDLEKEGINIIQIDEPALREGLPLKKSQWKEYLDKAVSAFRLSSSGAKNSTQIHTHMCYSEFNDIIESIADMDADVISIETSRSQMELLDAFAEFDYPNDIGPGVYDIHSPRVPSKEEILDLLEKATAVIDPEKLWVNPDCGLKTRGWEETLPALKAMVEAAGEMRERVMVSE